MYKTKIKSQLFGQISKESKFALTTLHVQNIRKQNTKWRTILMSEPKLVLDYVT